MAGGEVLIGGDILVTGGGYQIGGEMVGGGTSSCTGHDFDCTGGGMSPTPSGGSN